MANKVILTGNLGNDPELKAFDNGKCVASFSLATSETYKDSSGDKKTETEWHNCVIFGERAKVINQYTSKGSKLYVEGKIKYESYEKNGETKYITKIIVSNFEFLGGKNNDSNNQQNNNAQNQSTNQVQTGDESDDLPF